ncbi:glycosyl hydrolase, partial [bacterium]|nr:glycosyl hydrolase [bacterium]
MKRILAMFLLLVLGVSTVPAKEEKEDDHGFNSGAFSALEFRLLGPSFMSGRVGDFAVNPDNPAEYYVAVCSGGVWKTVNAGTTYEPIFDGEGSYSIGCVTLDPGDPKVVWVGAGENNSQRSVSYGDGVYKSVDGGQYWENMGLKESEHIGMIVVDPRDSDVVYVAAQGPLWRAGGDRGLYRTTDGGAAWVKILDIDEDTGVSEVHLDPRDPDTLYAVSYQRRRHVWTLLNGGPGSGVHKSTDGGATWRKIQRGLPEVELGRIGLDIALSRPDVLYAIVEAAEDESGFYRSDDAGENWRKMSDYVSTSPQYYQEIAVDPRDPDLVWSLNTWLAHTEDGGATWERASTSAKHVDDHAIWIDPADPRHILVGCDGGIYESWDRGGLWDFEANLPVTQFYKVHVDYDEPFYRVYGGTQDNNSLGAPHRTINVHGVRNSDWTITQGGDGFETQVDPTDANIVYSQYQYGGLARYDRRNGEGVDIQPQPAWGDPAYRFNWNSPLLISPHDHTRLYYGCQKLLRSDDRGSSWREISGDLSRQIDRNTLEIMGKIWSVDAVSKNRSTSFYGSLVSLDESPLREGLIYVGTDDGLIQVTEDGGAAWRRIDKFKGVPDRSYVGDVKASRFDAGTVFACFDNHKQGDFKPYLLRSDDYGESWKSIAGDLPERGTVHVVQQDHVNQDLLFAGTEFGAFFTVDGGAHWLQLKAGLPVIAVRDLDLQRRENDVALATFGRGIYILDDYTPLRHVSPERFEREAAILFPVRDAWLYHEATP